MRNQAERSISERSEQRRWRPGGASLPHPSGSNAAVDRFVNSAWRAAALPLLLLFAVPVVVLFTRSSPQQVLDSLRQEPVQQAIEISMRTTFTSLFFTVLLGTPVAYLIGRYNFRFKRLVDTLIDLPTILPPSVAGLVLLITFGRRGPVGGWLEDMGIQIAFTQAAVVLAQVFISAPFYIRAASLGFASVDEEIEQAAQLDGAGRWQVLRYVILPLSQTALLSGCMMSWARALGEFGATMIFAGNYPGRTQTMPTAIYLGFELSLDTALTLSVILVAVSFLTILVVKSLVSLRDG